MFENLQERFERAFKVLKGHGSITEVNVGDTLKEVRKALLDAGTDIDFQGVTGPVDFNEYGDLAQGTIEVNEYTSNTEFESLGKITADVPLP